MNLEYKIFENNMKKRLTDRLVDEYKDNNLNLNNQQGIAISSDSAQNTIEQENTTEENPISE